MSDLRISADLAGKAYTTPVITGGEQSREGAVAEKLRLQAILRSGALPIKLSIVKLDTISPSFGREFVKDIAIAGCGAILALFLIVYARYRRFKLALPLVCISACEVVIILGVASVIHWTLNLAAIAGIFAAIGTGIDALIIITDETTARGGRDVYSVRERVKRAFFIIFGTASTTIAAMLPLMFIGIGVMRGFAITTIIGVLAGIFITRPAYGKIVEKIL